MKKIEDSKEEEEERRKEKEKKINESHCPFWIL